MTWAPSWTPSWSTWGRHPLPRYVDGTTHLPVRELLVGCNGSDHGVLMRHGYKCAAWKRVSVLRGRLVHLPHVVCLRTCGARYVRMLLPYRRMQHGGAQPAGGGAQQLLNLLVVLRILLRKAANRKGGWSG